MCVHDCSANAQRGDTVLVHGASGAVSLLTDCIHLMSLQKSIFKAAT